MSPARILLRLGLVVLAVEALLAGVHIVLQPALAAAGLGAGPGPVIAHSLLLVSIAAPLAYVAVIRPYVAERISMETTLREGIEAISEGFQMYDADDRLVLCNSRFREMYDRTADLFVPGRRFEDILRDGVKRHQYPEAEERVEEWIARRMAMHRDPGEPIERQLPDGRWLKITERRTKDGYTVGIRTEITDLKVREQQLRESEERLRQIVDSLQEGFVLYDADDRIVMWNDKWLELHKEIADIIEVGAPFETTIRTSVARRLYPEAYGREDAFIARRIERHRNPGEPFVRQLHDGRWFVIREVPTPEGGIFALNIDITDLKRAETAAEEARHEAENADRAKSQFLTNMSHEFRTPLNAIIGFSDIIQSEAFGADERQKYREYARDINESGQLLLALVNDILDLAKVESGADELYEETLDVRSLVESVSHILRQRIVEGGLRFSRDVPDDLPALRADERKLKQILVNLLTNAVKFTARGGDIRLSVRRDPGEGHVFEIADSGIGIAPEDIPRALSRFGQVGAAAGETHAGTGLGLPLSTALAELHGGTLELKSRPGVGTTVTVRFPAGRVVPPAEGSARRSAT